MDWSIYFCGQWLINLAGALILSITFLQCCLKKKKKPRVEHGARIPTGVTNSDRSSEVFNSSPGKSRSPVSASPTPTDSSRKNSKRNTEKLLTPGKAEKKKKAKKKKSAESGKKEESKRSSRRASKEKQGEELLEVMSTQPSHPSSSDPDSVGTARIEIVPMKIPETPVKKAMKRPSKETVAVKKPSKEALAEKKPSRELMYTARKPSREVLTENGPAMKKSENCDNSSAQEGVF